MFAKAFRFFLLVCLPLAVSHAQQEPTLENLLCAIQERHMVVEQRKAIEEINFLQNQQADYGLVVTYTNQVQLAQIEWGGSIAPLPPPGSLDSLTMEDRVALLARASEQFDLLKQAYLNLGTDVLNEDIVPTTGSSFFLNGDGYTETDLPTVGRITPENYRTAQQALIQRVQRLLSERGLGDLALRHRWALLLDGKPQAGSAGRRRP